MLQDGVENFGLGSTEDVNDTAVDERTEGILNDDLHVCEQSPGAEVWLASNSGWEQGRTSERADQSTT